MRMRSLVKKLSAVSERSEYVMLLNPVFSKHLTASAAGSPFLTESIKESTAFCPVIMIKTSFP